MSCEKCNRLHPYTINKIASRNELDVLNRQLLKLVTVGTLEEVYLMRDWKKNSTVKSYEYSYLPRSQCASIDCEPFEDLIRFDQIGDGYTYDFRCQYCGVYYHINANTYNGRIEFCERSTQNIHKILFEKSEDLKKAQADQQREARRSLRESRLKWGPVLRKK